MSRTMDAFDVRMQTFGGKTMVDKRQYADRFMQEKGAFIRTSNLYDNNDPMKINVYEYQQPIKSPGPAF